MYWHFNDRLVTLPRFRNQRHNSALMHQQSRAGRTQRGNILFLILLAVALFAALNYAVTSSMRGGGKDASSENAEAAAAEILQWFAAVDAAVLRMKLAEGIAYEDISFRYDAKYYNGTGLPNYMSNTRCTTDKCHVFRTGGGGVRPPDFSKYGNANVTGVAGNHLGAGYMALFMMQWPGAGTSANDLTMWFYMISEPVCDAVKRRIGQTNTPGFGGSGVFGHVASNWDNSAYVFTTNIATLSGNDIFVSTTNYPGTSDAHCMIRYVVIKR